MNSIDIISFTEEQFSLLAKGQLQTVKTAQQRKDRLYKALQEKLRKEKHRLVKNGVFCSRIFNFIEDRLTFEYEREVEIIRQCLLFYLHYSMKPNQSTTDSVTYLVDYSLSEEERMGVVREFYESTYTNDAKGLYAAFLQDMVAPQYLGELYAPLHDYFYALAQK